jgi:Zn-dependent metalloprotease
MKRSVTKRILAVLLAAALVLGAAGCGIKNDQTEAPTAPASTAEQTEAVTEPVTDPATEPVTEPVTAPVTEPVEVTEPVTEPPTTEAVPPATEPADQPTEPAEPESYSLFEHSSLIDTPENLANQGGQAGEIAQTAPKQLTIEDIQAMNDSLVIDLYNNNGYLSTLVGKFYDKPIANAEDGVESIRGMASLLGLTKGCEFFVVYGERDNDGYTYYTYQQRYGGYTLQYSTLRIVVDPDGYAAGLTCSFVPNVGMAEPEDGISAGEAEQVVRDTFPSLKLTYYSNNTVRLAAMFSNVVYNCWVVYTNNPDASAAFDMPYVAHYVTTDGKYLAPIPAADFARSSQDAQNVDHYFDGLTTEEHSFTVTMADGSKKTVTVPVARNAKDGRYYLMDPSRKIALAQYADFAFRGLLNFVSSTRADQGFSDNNLLVYANVIMAYDFYRERGITSVDGFGRPILVTVGYCNENGEAIDNECFYGINQGWACLAFSEGNRDGDCLDIVTHEFTHGVTSQSMQGIFYRNEPGAINEAYSDIMGNICEKLLGQTNDPGWLITENSGDIARDMADPNRFQQPAFVGDEYYCPPVLAPSMNVNDYGGVHINNSLVGHMAYLLDEAGMSLDEQFSMWVTSIEMLTPMSDYEDLHGILLFSLKINGMLQKYGPALNKAFADAGLNEDWNVSYREATKKNCGRISFQTDGYLAGAEVQVRFANTSGKIVSRAYPDKDGIVSALLPAGTYIAQILLVENNQAYYYNFTGSGWAEGGDFGRFQVTSSSVQSLPSVNSGKAVVEGPGGEEPQPPEPQPPEEAGEWKLVTYNGGYFSLVIPEGWRVEMQGAFGDYCLKVYDPSRPSRQFFYYAALAPLHKSEAARRALNPYDFTGQIVSGPVLTQHDIGGVLDVWQDCIDYQLRWTGKQLFTSLYDIDKVAVYPYQGPYAGTPGIESVAMAWADAENGDECLLGISGTLYDMDIYNYTGGNWYYTLYDTVGILLPEEEFEDYAEVLAGCVVSLEFTQDYINASKNSGFPLASNAERQEAFEVFAGVILELYDLLSE